MSAAYIFYFQFLASFAWRVYISRIAGEILEYKSGTIIALQITAYRIIYYLINMKNFKIYLFISLLLNTLNVFASPPIPGDFTGRELGSGYLSALERGVVAELNLARTQPARYADFLIEYSKLFVGRELREPGEVTILTREGKSAVLEAIRFLKIQKSLPSVTASIGLSKAADDMVWMQENSSQVGHTGRDGSKFSDRISRYGTWGGSCAENIDYGYNSARKIVMALIIDDGVSNRGHRRSIFNPGFRRVGVACGNHQTYRYMCVIEFASSYTEK